LVRGNGSQGERNHDLGSELLEQFIESCKCKYEWHLISGQCNLRFLSTKVLQDSVATHINYGRIFIDSFTANLLQSVKVKKLKLG